MDDHVKQRGLVQPSVCRIINFIDATKLLKKNDCLWKCDDVGEESAQIERAKHLRETSKQFRKMMGSKLRDSDALAASFTQDCVSLCCNGCYIDLCKSHDDRQDVASSKDQTWGYFNPLF